MFIGVKDSMWATYNKHTICYLAIDSTFPYNYNIFINVNVNYSKPFVIFYIIRK
jgi:hypothetical protein